MGGGGARGAALSHFSECLYRRDLGKIGILGRNGIGILGGGDFFQVGLENSLY